MPFRSHKTIVVPCGLRDTRSRAEKLADVEYVKSVRAMCGSQTFLSEVGYALHKIREKADTATSTEELRGIQVGLSVIKTMMIAPVIMDKILERIEQGENPVNEMEGMELG